MIGNLTEDIYPFLRAALFQLDAELAHHLSLKSLRLMEKSGLLNLLTSQEDFCSPTECMGLTFPNKIGLAAGLDKEGNTIDALGHLGFGFIEIGTITPRPQSGNPKPRLFRLIEQEAIINRMGFNNPGIDQGVKNVKNRISYRGIVGFNIGKNKDTPNENAADDYLTCLRGAHSVADYIAVNLSSPNTPGLRDLQNADSTARLLETLKREEEKLRTQDHRRVPILFKIAPDLDDAHIASLSQVFRNGGLDGLIATNTTISRTGVEKNPLHTQAGGLSGSPLTEKSTNVIAQFHAHLGSNIPIIGVGGISNLSQAQQKIKAGASLVQIYSSFIYQGPALVKKLASSL